MISRFDRETLAGFVSPQSYLTPEGIEYLSTNGNVSTLPYLEIKLVSFVREFQQGEPRMEMRLFASRPKHEGLWIRMRFRDGDLMDGVLTNNLLQVEPAGFTFLPPDPGYQFQRLFVPRAALAEITVLGVVGAPLRRKKAVATREQLELGL